MYKSLLATGALTALLLAPNVMAASEFEKNDASVRFMFENKTNHDIFFDAEKTFYEEVKFKGEFYQTNTLSYPPHLSFFNNNDLEGDERNYSDGYTFEEFGEDWEVCPEKIETNQKCYIKLRNVDASHTSQSKVIVSFYGKGTDTYGNPITEEYSFKIKVDSDSCKHDINLKSHYYQWVTKHNTKFIKGNLEMVEAKNKKTVCRMNGVSVKDASFRFNFVEI